MGAAKILPRGECNRTTTLRPAKKNNCCWSVHWWQDSFLLRWRNFLCSFEISRWVLWVGVSEPLVVAWMVRANQRETRCAALESGRSCVSGCCQEAWDALLENGHGRECYREGRKQDRTSAFGAGGGWPTLCLKLPVAPPALCIYSLEHSLCHQIRQ